MRKVSVVMRQQIEQAWRMGLLETYADGRRFVQKCKERGLSKTDCVDEQVAAVMHERNRCEMLEPCPDWAKEAA